MYTANQIRRRVRSYLRSAVLAKRLIETKLNSTQDKNASVDEEVSKKKPAKDLK